jgi:esterase/lipase
MLSRVGIASLRIDFRGSGDSEGNFADTTIKTQLEDARCALEFLQKHPNIDTQKIALLGRSLGGALATQLASEMDTCAAIALWCPLFDVKPWTSKHTGDEFRFLGQPLSPECIAEFLALDATSALSKIEEIPMLIISAGKDEILGSYHHEKYLSERKQATLHVALENSCHDFSYIPEQEKLLQITTSFLQGYL